MTDLCSDVHIEPLPGTSKVGDTYVLLEHTGAWSHDILDGHTFTAEVSSRLKALGVGLYLIRKPGRAGHVDKPLKTVYLVFGSAGIAETLTVEKAEDVCSLDLSGPGKNGAARVVDPILLICTHAKRDVCCAVKGRPIAASLCRAFPEAPIWECSHTKGHRFAPSMVLMPWGYAWGRLNEVASQELYRTARRGELFLPGCRGRGIWAPEGQVAEVAVAEHLASNGEKPRLGQFVWERIDDSSLITEASGDRSWIVSMHEAEVEGVVASCGNPPTTGKAWFVDSVVKQQP